MLALTTFDLTAREAEVLRWVCREATNAEIASAPTAERTVKSQVSAVLAKLGARTVRPPVIILAFEAGIVGARGASRPDSFPRATIRVMSSRGAADATTSRTAEHARPDHFLLHLSDTHLLPRGDKLYGSVSPERSLERLFADLEAGGTRPEAIVFTGDLADHGEASAYRLLRRIVEPAARRLGAEVIWCMGNHDDRGTFRRVLFGQVANARPVDRVYDVNGLRLITIDTSVPGEHWGALSGAQLDWLAEELASPAPHGTVLAMHHPPLPCIQDLAVLVELREQRELAEVVAGSDIRAILAGHLHFSTSGTFAGVPVSVASATCYTQDLTTEAWGTRPQDGAQSYNLVHVYDETVLHSVVPIAAGRVLSTTSAEDSAAVLAAHGVVIPPPEHAPIRRPADPVDAELLAMTSPITLPQRSE